PSRDGSCKKENRRSTPWRLLAQSQRTRRRTTRAFHANEPRTREILMGIRITGVGAYVPDRQMTNDDLARMVDTSGEWISSRTGILARRISAPDEAPSDMAREAALRCLSHAGIDKSAVDLIIVACASPDQIQPAVACLVQEKLGIAESGCPAFDVNSVCAGFVFALSTAQGMMLSAPKQYRNALVIGADAFSKILNWDDR